MLIRALIVTEILAILFAALLGGSFVERLLQESSVHWPEAVVNLFFPWALLILLALTVDAVFRGRGLRSWGLQLSRPRLEDWRVVCRLFVLGGVVPFALIPFLPPPPHTPNDFLTLAAGLLAPLLGQELYVAGFGFRRLHDGFKPFGIALVIAALFILAHANHAGQGLIGLAYLAAMGWQGLIWAAARLSGRGLVPLMAAHLLILLLGAAPLWGLIVALAAALFALPGTRQWLAEMLPAMRPWSRTRHGDRRAE